MGKLSIKTMWNLFLGSRNNQELMDININSTDGSKTLTENKTNNL
ncbi:hypothetical protein [Tenacibaculum sp. C7A-26P2]